MLLLSAAAVALWPRTYGTEATFVVDGAAKVGNPVALAGKVEAALLEREVLAVIAIELPPELRSPDPIGRLRAGIRVQSRGAAGYGVEFRGSDPHSVQRIANRLADRAVLLVPKLTASPQDNSPALALAARTRAVTEFLTAHPEMTLDSGKPSGSADSGLEALRREKGQIEQRLATGATDNPYTDPASDPEVLNRRLTELKNTIARREKALKEPHGATPKGVGPELVAQWRQLLADLATAQANASAPLPPPQALTAHVTARATLPSSPLTPNRLVLSLVAVLLSAAAAMVAYVLPRKPEHGRRQAPRSVPPAVRSEPPPPATQRLAGGTAPMIGVAGSSSAPPAPGSAALPHAAPPFAPANNPSDRPIPRSDPPPSLRPGSEPPGPIAVQRTVVLGGPSASSNPPPARRNTTPGGLEAPNPQAIALASTALASPGASASAPPFGSRPPPGAGSYSVSSSHPPPLDPRMAGPGRTSVERLSPLQSARPPSQSTVPGPASRRGMSPQPQVNAPLIVSRPPALDPEAETWAARFETVPPPEETPPAAEPAAEPGAEEAPKKRAGRWKTQVMGSMVPLEVMAAREDLGPPPSSEAIQSYRPPVDATVRQAQVPSPVASAVVHHDVPLGWRANLNAAAPDILALRDGVLQQAQGRRLTLLVTGHAKPERAQVAGALGLALAQSGAQTLLVEADFDSPELHRALNLSTPPGVGFSQQLMARRNARQQEPWAVMRCTPNLLVMAEGRFRSPGSVATKEFERALLELRELHHVVIVHAPALTKQEDLRPLSALSQGAVIVEPGQPSKMRFNEDPLRGVV